MLYRGYVEYSYLFIYLYNKEQYNNKLSINCAFVGSSHKIKFKKNYFDSLLVAGCENLTNTHTQWEGKTQSFLCYSNKYIYLRRVFTNNQQVYFMTPYYHTPQLLRVSTHTRHHQGALLCLLSYINNMCKFMVSSSCG
jgi:hypothetical protein